MGATQQTKECESKEQETAPGQPASHAVILSGKQQGSQRSGPGADRE
jgi:hypothetical protein